MVRGAVWRVQKRPGQNPGRNGPVLLSPTREGSIARRRLKRASGHVVGLFVLVVRPVLLPQPIQRVGRARRGEPLGAAEGSLSGLTRRTRRRTACLCLPARGISTRRLAEGRGGIGRLGIRGKTRSRRVRTAGACGGALCPRAGGRPLVRGRLLTPRRLGVGFRQSEGEEDKSERKSAEKRRKRSRWSNAEDSTEVEGTARSVLIPGKEAPLVS
jgi:hypothetical protein